MAAGLSKGWETSGVVGQDPVKLLEAAKAEAHAATPIKGRKAPSKKPARKQARIDERNAAIAQALAAPKVEKTDAAKTAKKAKAASKTDAKK